MNIDEKLKLQKRENLINHSNLINSIMISLKPGLFKLFFYKITKENLKKFFKLIREECLHAE